MNKVTGDGGHKEIQSNDHEPLPMSHKFQKGVNAPVKGIEVEMMKKRVPLKSRLVERAERGTGTRPALKQFHGSVGDLLENARTIIVDVEKIEEGLLEKILGVEAFVEASKKIEALFEAQKNLREAAVNNLLYAQRALVALEDAFENISANFDSETTLRQKNVSVNLGKVLNGFQELGEDFKDIMKPGSKELTVAELKVIQQKMDNLIKLIALFEDNSTLWKGKSFSQKEFQSDLESLRTMMGHFNNAVKILTENKTNIVGTLSQLQDVDFKKLEENKINYLAMALVGLAIAIAAVLVGLLVMSGVGAIVVLVLGAVGGGIVALTGAGLGISESATVAEWKNPEYMEELNKLIQDAGEYLKPLGER